ncbi:hypothetical protein AXG93_4010s1290 [Marchantia polymorpha subsp. ruderalis]|uniref:Uncharacterized protein n=1 Tax=Marchantia polymorpha subsp. ruderalis TaxID=1480154 RepID=A0A176VIZ4_MARPO|nr:hypothetical protein AXG93_4010s1290 [Marchantia polymorpha subsp. ruderalis]
METCRQSKSDTIEDVIASAKAFETSTLNKNRKDREFDEWKSKHSQRRRRPETSSSKKSSSSKESSESKDFLSLEEERLRWKAARKKKSKRMPMPNKSSVAIVSKVDALVKDFADLKVHVVDLSPDRTDPDDTWPEDEVLVRKIETQSATRHTDASLVSSKRDKKRALSIPNANASTTKDLWPKTLESLA